MSASYNEGLVKGLEVSTSAVAGPAKGLAAPMLSWPWKRAWPT